MRHGSLDQSNADVRELKDKIVDDIRKSGFPLEMQIIQSCHDRGFSVEPNIRYSVDESLKEIDVYSSLYSSGRTRDGVEYLTISRLLVECKQSSRPWVFFSAPVHQSDSIMFFLNHRSGFNRHLRKSELPSVLGQMVNNPLHHYESVDIPKCISYFEAFKSEKSSSRSSIHDSIDSVLTFLRSELDERTMTDALGIVTEAFYPVVVVDGGLYEASVLEDEITVTEREHVFLIQNRNDHKFVIDIVGNEHWPEFLTLIEQDHKEVLKVVQSLQFPSETVADMKDYRD